MLSGNHPEGPYSGLLARCYMYMNWKYDLKMSDTLLTSLLSMSTYKPPSCQERWKSLVVSQYSGHMNPFVDEFPHNPRAKNERRN